MPGTFRPVLGVLKNLLKRFGVSEFIAAGDRKDKFKIGAFKLGSFPKQKFTSNGCICLKNHNF